MNGGDKLLLEKSHCFAFKEIASQPFSFVSFYAFQVQLIVGTKRFDCLMIVQVRLVQRNRFVQMFIEDDGGTRYLSRVGRVYSLRVNFR